MSAVERGRVLVSGHARGPVFAFRAPVSFWGGVDPERGVVSDPRHPDHGATLAGRVLVVPETVGSSSSSAVMLELLRGRRAPAGLVLGNVDAILVLGVIVARELGEPTIPVVLLDGEALARAMVASAAVLEPDGTVRLDG